MRRDGWLGGFFPELTNVPMLQGVGFFLIDEGMGYDIKLA
jgi:hypothetical protein